MFLCEKYRNLNEVLMLQTLSYSLTTSNLQPFVREELSKAERGTPRQVEVIRRGAKSEVVGTSREMVLQVPPVSTVQTDGSDYNISPRLETPTPWYHRNWQALTSHMNS